jgi:hypothetical protein
MVTRVLLAPIIQWIKFKIRTIRKKRTMVLRERLLELIICEELNPNQFYVKTGLGNGFLDKVGERLKSPSVEKISRTFPHWNIDYLQTGEGEKYKEIVQNNEIANSKIQNSNVQQGTNINSIEVIVEITRSYQEIIRKQEEHIGRLIGLIEKSK